MSEKNQSASDQPEMASGPIAPRPARGRPSKYRAEFAEQARKLCLLGATDQELADFFGVEVRTVYRWKGDHNDFCQSLKAGKDEADARVERSLYQQAIGYEQDEVKIFMPAQAEAPVYAPFRAKVAPNVTAAIFWLKNRRKEDWRDRTELTGKDGGPVEHAVTHGLPEGLGGLLDRFTTRGQAAGAEVLGADRPILPAD